MYVLVVKGARRATLAVHKCESEDELRELLGAYHALGYSPDALQVTTRQEETKAA